MLPLSDISKIEIFGFFDLPIYDPSAISGGKYSNVNGYLPRYVIIGNEVIVKNRFVKILIYDIDNIIIFSYYIKNKLNKNHYIYDLVYQEMDKEIGGRVKIIFDEGNNEIIKGNHFKTKNEANEVWMKIRYL